MERSMMISAKGRAIGTARIYQSMSMSELAQKAGLSVASISKIERGAAQSVRL